MRIVLDKAEHRRAENHLDRGLELCDRGDVGVGLLWLARALERAPESAEDLKPIIRTHLAGWGRRVIPLKACLDSPEPVTAAALSPDGRTVWAAGQDKYLRRWDVDSRELLGAPTRLHAAVMVIAWGPRGKVLTVCNDGTPQLWDAKRGAPVGRPLPHKAASAAWDPCGQYLVTGGRKEASVFGGATEGASRGPVFRQKGKVRVLAVSPNGKTELTGEGKNARLWDAESGQDTVGPLNHLGEVFAAAFSPDGRSILTSAALIPGAVRLPMSYGEDRMIRLWDAATGKPRGIPLRHEGIVERSLSARTGYRSSRAVTTGRLASGASRRTREWGSRWPTKRRCARWRSQATAARS